MSATASIRRLRHTPRKVRLVADLIRGKSLSEAKAVLNTVVKSASLPVLKLLQSAEANAKNAGATGIENFLVKEVRVDADTVMKRFNPRARGSSAQILKRMSRVSITLSESSAPAKSLKAKKLQAKS